MREPSYRLFLVFLIGAALAGAALILTVPGLFDPGGAIRAWVCGGLGLTVAGFARAAWYVRPDRASRR